MARIVTAGLLTFNLATHLDPMTQELYDGVTVTDGAVAHRWKGATGRLRLRPYVDATNGTMLDAVNTAESANVPLTLTGSNIRFLTNAGLSIQLEAGGFQSWYQQNIRFGIIGSAAALIGGGVAGDFAIRAEADLVLATGGGNERVRLSGGNFYLGTTATTPNPGVFLGASGSCAIGNNAQASGWQFLNFARSGSLIGSITQNGTTAVQYNTTSDRRLKTDIVDAPDAGADIDAIRVVSHAWKSAPDEKVKYSFIAQDLHAVMPEAVKVGDDGEEVEDAWGVDPSKLVGLLVREVQSLRRRVTALESA